MEDDIRDSMSPTQRRLYEAASPEARVQIQAYEGDKDLAIAEGRCVHPMAGCGRPVTPDRAEEFADERGIGPPPTDVIFALIEAYEKTGICPYCTLSHMTEVMRQGIEWFKQRSSAPHN